MNLQELQCKEVTMDREHNAKIIDDHIEATILHMLQTNIDIEPEDDWADLAQTKIYEMGGTLCYLDYTDVNVRMFEGSDIWLVLDISIEVEWDEESAPVILGVVYNRIRCYWMDMEFDLSDSEAIQVLLTAEIKTW